MGMASPRGDSLEKPPEDVLRDAGKLPFVEKESSGTPRFIEVLAGAGGVSIAGVPLRDIF